MDLQSTILSSGAIDSIAAQLGISPESARGGAAALLPAILGGFKREAQQRPDGLEGLIGGIGQLGGGSLAESVVSPGATDPTPGNEILGSIFGSKDVSRTVAAHAGSQSGVDPTLLKRMLPMLAMLAAGFFASRAGAGATAPGPMPQPSSGGLGGMLGSIIGGLSGGAAASQAGGLGGIGAMLDLDGDGNPLDDIIGMTGRLTGR